MSIRKYKWIIITLLLVIGTMMMIFIFSSQNVESSDGLSHAVTRVVLKIYDYFSAKVPGWFEEPEVVESDYSFFEDMNHYVRKVAHMTEYAILAIFLLLHFKAIADFRNRAIGIQWGLLDACCCFLYACSDELHQMFVDGRGPAFKDVMIDMIGAVAGIIFISLIILNRNRRKKP